MAQSFPAARWSLQLAAPLVLLLLLLASVPFSSAQPGSRDLSPEEFTTAVLTKPTFVKFFAPWCGHCKALAPVWEEAAQLVHREHPNVQLVGMDCVAHGDICSRFSVRGYPTLIYIRPTLSDAELLAMSKSDPTGLSKLPRMSYLYSGTRTPLAMEHFVSNQLEWSRVTPKDFPLTLPAEPVLMQLVEREQQVKEAVEGQVNGQEAAASKPLQAAVKAGLSERGAVGVLNRMASLLKEHGVAENRTDASRDVAASSWVLNALLVVVVVLIAIVAMFLYLTARAGVKPSKVV